MYPEFDEEFDSSELEFVRMDRESTGSFITLRLPMKMNSRQVDEWVAQGMRGWELIQTTEFNPDDELADYGYNIMDRILSGNDNEV